MASETYLDMLTFILEQWSVDVAQRFDDRVNTLLDKLITFEQLCPPSEKIPELRKCIISKQSSLVYQIRDDYIELVAFFDNRSDHPY